MVVPNDMSTAVTTGWVSEVAHKRYTQYVADQHGDVTDLARLCSVMFNAGGSHATRCMVEFGDIIPQLHRIEGRVKRLLELLEAFQ